jgi:hypothetical protein
MGDPFKGLEKILPVHVTSENILPAVLTAHDVINRPGYSTLNSRGMPARLPARSQLRQDHGLTPFFPTARHFSSGARMSSAFGIRSSFGFRKFGFRISGQFITGSGCKSRLP